MIKLTKENVMEITDKMKAEGLLFKIGNNCLEHGNMLTAHEAHGWPEGYNNEEITGELVKPLEQLKKLGIEKWAADFNIKRFDLQLKSMGFKSEDIYSDSHIRSKIRECKKDLDFWEAEAKLRGIVI